MRRGTNGSPYNRIRLCIHFLTILHCVLLEEILFAEFNLLLKKGNRDLARI